MSEEMILLGIAMLAISGIGARALGHWYLESEHAPRVGKFPATWARGCSLLLAVSGTLAVASIIGLALSPPCGGFISAPGFFWALIICEVAIERQHRAQKLAPARVRID